MATGPRQRLGHGLKNTFDKNRILYNIAAFPKLATGSVGGMNKPATTGCRQDPPRPAAFSDGGCFSVTDQTLLLERPVDGVAVIRLHRPQAHNALDLAMQAALDALLTTLESDDNIRAVVLTGSGEKAFSAGYDIHEMQHFDRDALLLAQLRREPWIWHLANYSKPLLGAINGIAHGAGAIIATALDIRIGGPKTEFRYTAAKYGGANNTWQLAPVVGLAKAKEFLMTARRIKADEALQAGLLNHLVDEADVLPRTIAMAAEIAANPPEGIRHTKALLHANIGAAFDAAYRAENAVMMNELAPRPPAELFDQFLNQHRGPK